MSKTIITLCCMKFKHGKRYNYDIPITGERREFKDGVFLCDTSLGVVFAKEVRPKVYESVSLKGHMMYEEAEESE